ncbi:glycosyltransferase family 4 protein [Halosolutus gelatinilyticus]|uniref:glycosyltransferase family 4 protein n=1 Tax=Halosolutus gelatinilyticus TaxID=2931975 RepID=UPI001FF0E89D|nr:glycosyltransferase family 4 protein [Halosolutus gelatinilyticus]
MNVLMVTNGKYEPDIRVRREAEGLVTAGHDVHVVCRGQYDEKCCYSLNDVAVTRVCANSKVVHHAAERVYAATWYHPIWLRELERILSNKHFDTIYYHDIEHAKLATMFANQYDLSIVADLHEMYPEAVKLWREGLSFRDRLNSKILLTPPWRYQRLERYAVKRTDALITISEELLNYFAARYNRRNLTSGVVRNVPDLERLDSMDVTPLDYDADYVISYIGGFTPQRGIETLIQALPSILEEIPDTKLLLVGDGNDEYVESLRRLVRRREVSDAVEFTGWVDFEKVPAYYEASTVTVIPYHRRKASQYALPNKLFQAMAFQTPILATDLPTMRRILAETGAGTTTAETPGAIATELKRLVTQPKILSEMGENGRQAVEKRFNIRAELETVLTIVENSDSEQ